jgi:hypothetical protein
MKHGHHVRVKARHDVFHHLASLRVNQTGSDIPCVKDGIISTQINNYEN